MPDHQAHKTATEGTGVKCILYGKLKKWEKTHTGEGNCISNTRCVSAVCSWFLTSVILM